MKLSEIAKILGGELVGDGDVEVEKVSEIQNASKGDITFIANPKYEKFFETTEASAVIVGKNFSRRREDVSLIMVDEPYYAFVKVLKLLNPRLNFYPRVFIRQQLSQEAPFSAGMFALVQMSLSEKEQK